jgi:hypothetical protein
LLVVIRDTNIDTYTNVLYRGPYMTNSETSTFTFGLVLGLALVVLGISAYVLSNFASVTALIPAVFGVLIVLLSVVGRQTDRHRLASYGIGLLAVLGVLGSARGIPAMIALLTGKSVASTIAAVSQGAMIVICLILLATVVKYVLATR